MLENYWFIKIQIIAQKWAMCQIWNISDSVAEGRLKK